MCPILKRSRNVFAVTSIALIIGRDWPRWLHPLLQSLIGIPGTLVPLSSRYPRSVIFLQVVRLSRSLCQLVRFGGETGGARGLSLAPNLIERDVQALHRTTARWRHGWVMVQPRRLSRCRTQACMPGGAHHWGHPPGVCMCLCASLGASSRGLYCVYIT